MIPVPSVTMRCIGNSKLLWTTIAGYQGSKIGVDQLTESLSVVGGLNNSSIVPGHIIE